MVAALTNESATSKSVYFAHCTSEMIFITHLLTEEPEKLAGPLLADTYVTLLKGRNAWYGQMLAKGELSPDMGDSIKGKGMIQVCLYILPSNMSKVMICSCNLSHSSNFPGCLCSWGILRAPQSVQPKCKTSRRKQTGCSCWVVPNPENIIQDTDQKVRSHTHLNSRLVSFYNMQYLSS